MEKKRRITFYKDLNGPYREQIRLHARMTPEECYQEYIELRKLYFQVVGELPKPDYHIQISRPSWM